MKKIFFTVLSVLFYHLSAQVGIGTNQPNASAALHVESSNKGFLLPRLTQAQREAIVDPAQGLMIYNSTIKCVEVFKGTSGNNSADWLNLCAGNGNGGGGGNSGNGTIASIDCLTPSQNIPLNSTANANITIQIPYTGGNGGSYSAVTVASTTVTGLSLGITAGNFATGNGVLQATISGTPSGVGNANFALSIGGQTCTITAESAVAAQNGDLFVNVLSIQNLVGQLVHNAPISNVKRLVSITNTGAPKFIEDHVVEDGWGNLFTGAQATLKSQIIKTGIHTYELVFEGTPVTTISLTNNWATSVPFDNSNDANKVVDITGIDIDLFESIEPTVTSFDLSNLQWQQHTDPSDVNSALTNATFNISDFDVTSTSVPHAVVEIPYTGGNGGVVKAFNTVYNLSEELGLYSQSLTKDRTDGSTNPDYLALQNGNGNIRFGIYGPIIKSGTYTHNIENLFGQDITISYTINPPTTAGTASSAFFNNNPANTTRNINASLSANQIFYQTHVNDIDYSGGNDEVMDGFEVQSTGVTGLTLYIPATRLASAGGSIPSSNSYCRIEGVPSATTGVATFNFSIGGQALTYTVTFS